VSKRKKHLSHLSIEELELALRIVSSSLAEETSPLERPEPIPPTLEHLSPKQWEKLFLVHQQLMFQRQHSPIH
jgi:hypothetical protein